MPCKRKIVDIEKLFENAKVEKKSKCLSFSKHHESEIPEKEHSQRKIEWKQLQGHEFKMTNEISS